MTIKERIKYTLRKYPDTKYNRAEFMLRYMGEFYGVAIYITFAQFKEFWADEAGIERSLRECLKEDEFKLKPEQDQRRYKKASEFRQNNMTKKENKTCEKCGGELGTLLLRDESYDKCVDCGWINH